MKKFLAVTAVLAIFCFLAVVPNVYAQFDKMLFFEDGRDGKEVSDVWTSGPYYKKYQSEFPKSKTRFMHTLVVIRFPGEEYLLLKGKFVYHYYSPDGSLFGEGKQDQILDLWSKDYYYISLGYGWDQPGNWPVGVYTVKVWWDDEFIGQGFFKIYEDRDPLDIGKKVAMSGELMQTRDGEPYWAKDSEGNDTHLFRVVAYVKKDWIIFCEIPKDNSGEAVMWGRYSTSDPYKKRVLTADGKTKTYNSVTKSEFEQAAWRILKHFGY